MSFRFVSRASNARRNSSQESWGKRSKSLAVEPRVLTRDIARGFDDRAQPGARSLSALLLAATIRALSIVIDRSFPEVAYEFHGRSQLGGSGGEFLGQQGIFDVPP